jgi:outer membrane protein assembly factor BamD
MKQDYPAAIARLKSMSDAYPLYSEADETLYILGQSYQAEADLIRKIPSSKLPETKKATLIKKYEQDAASSYSKIVTRYPAMPRADAAKKRLADLHVPVPTPTPEAVAQNKAEQQSRGKQSKKDYAMGFMHHRPDVSSAAKVGEPTVVDPPQTSAVELVRNANASLTGPSTVTKGGSGSLGIETTGTGPAPANDAVPRSDNGASGAETAAPVETGTPTPTSPTTNGGTSSTTAATTSTAPAAAPAPVNDAATESSTTTNTVPAAAPARVNDAATDPAASSSTTTQATPAAQTTSSTDSSQASSTDSTSKKKKKKGLAKLNPF